MSDLYFLSYDYLFVEIGAYFQNLSPCTNLKCMIQKFFQSILDTSRKKTKYPYFKNLFRNERKKFKIFVFSKMARNDFHHILWVYCTFKPQQYGTFDFSRKILITRIIFLIFYLQPNVAPKSNDQFCSNSIFRVLLQLSPARPFHFRPTLNIKGTLMLRVVHIRNKME